MSIFADIESLEQRVQELLEAAGNYGSVDDFVAAYTRTILDTLGDLSQAEIAALDLQSLVAEALEKTASFINVGLASEIQQGVNSTLAETAAFYSARGLDVPELADAIARRKDVQELTELFTTNMASMRKELLDGTVDTLQHELAQGFLDRADMEELIFQYADGKAHFARVNARMIVKTYNQIGRNHIQESAELKHGYYYGDTRANTRAFCLRLIGKVFTMEQIEQMDNGQLAPVKIYCGGWNCIHSWLWVDPQWDAQLQAKINTDPIVSVQEEYLTIKVPGRN